MIQADVFKAARDAARFRLPPEEARNSFGYYIDIANDWENYRTPDDLVYWFGIHSTHVAQFQELIHNLGALSDEELDWAKRYVMFFDRATRLLTTSGLRADLRYDIAETLTDWRTILEFVDLPGNVLDFGAGCARQCVSAFLRNPDVTYTAIDGTLAGYTVQNLVFSLLDVLSPNGRSYDFLDFQVATKPYPKIAEAKKGSRFHVPVWMAEDHIPEKFYDVMIGAHVHNELSGYDFLRLLHCAEKGLKDDGVLYLRSEIFVTDPRDFFDAVDLHAMEVVELLAERGFVPVSCKFHTYLTTVFARVGSKHYNAAKASDASDTQFLNITDNREMSERAAQDFTRRQMSEIATSGRRVVVAGGPNSFFDDFVTPVLAQMGDNAKVFNELDLVGPDAEKLVTEIKQFQPEIVVIPSHLLGAIEPLITGAFPEGHFPIRQHYFFPIVYFFTEECSRRSSIFDNELKTAIDIGVNEETFPLDRILA
jgi:hypothetical protein